MSVQFKIEEIDFSPNHKDDSTSSTIPTKICLACGLPVSCYQEEVKYEVPPPPENEIFSSFCELLQISLSGEVVWWDFNPLTDSSSGIFCADCKLELGLLTDLNRRLKELERDLQNGIEVFKEKCCRAEVLFKNMYERDPRYVKIRTQITQKPEEAVEYLDEIPIPVPAIPGVKKSTRRKKKEQTANNITISTSPVVKLSNADKEIADKYIDPSTRKKTESTAEHELEMEDADFIPDESQHFSLSDSDYEPEPPPRRGRGRPPKKNKTASTKNETKSVSKPKIPRTKKTSEGKPKRRRKEVAPENLLEHEEEEPDETPCKRRRKTRVKLGQDDVNSDSDEYRPSETEGDADSDPEYVEENGKRERLRLNPETGFYYMCGSAFELIDGKYLCMTCKEQQKKEVIMKRENVRTHALRHLNKHLCELCDYSGSSKRDLERHMFRAHSKSRFIPCPVCGKPVSAPNKRSMKRHITTHYSEQEKQEAIARGDKYVYMGSNGKRKAQCDYCGKSFKDKRNLQEHIVVKHPGPEADELSKTLTELCAKCGKIVLRVNLRIHQDRCQDTTGSNKKFVCVLCNKRFYTPRSLTAHKIASHSLNFPFKCSVCSRGYLTELRLQLHMNRHQNHRPFTCPHCPSAFFTKSNLNRHVSIYHDEGRNPRRKQFLKKRFKDEIAGPKDTVSNVGEVKSKNDFASVPEFLGDPSLASNDQLDTNALPSS